MKLVNAFARPRVPAKDWKGADHGWTFVLALPTKSARDAAIATVHADAKRLGRKIRTERISPTRFEVLGAKSTLHTIFATTAFQ